MNIVHLHIPINSKKIIGYSFVLPIEQEGILLSSKSLVANLGTYKAE